MRKPPARLIACACAVLAAAARADEYVPADRGEAPRGGGVRLLPEQFLRGYDPITAYYPDDIAEDRGPADDGAKRLRLEPEWPGAFSWADKRTLQFRPAEPWPALQRFAVTAGSARRVLTTMMSAPESISPAAGSDELRPFRVLTLTFPQALPLASLKSMLRLDIADLPGLADSPRRNVKSFALAQLPRASQRDAATYAITLDDDVPEGKMLVVRVALALGDEDKVLWQGRLSTRRPFHLYQVNCGQGVADVAGSGALAKDLALSCGTTGQGPQLLFSAPVADLTLTQIKALVHLDPTVPDLHFEPYGGRVQLTGHFAPDTLYRLRLQAAKISDDSGRPLQDPRGAELFFYLGHKTPFLRWSAATAILEARGPRMVPAIGHGEARADVRIYRVDPLYPGLWPFPDQPVVIDEEKAPPFPGEEPETPKEPGEGPVGSRELKEHIELLGSPLVSKVVDLPLANRAGTAKFGLDLPPLLDPVVGANRPGTYLVGLRRLTGAPQRSYVRVQITNLSLTAVEERERAVLFVRTLDDARPVGGAQVVLEGTHMVRVPDNRAPQGYRDEEQPAREERVADGAGAVRLERLEGWRKLFRISIRSGDDVLVIDPREPPPRFASNHWSPGSRWLTWLFEPAQPSPNEKLLGFLFTERPIYRPGEKVFIKGYVRIKQQGELISAGDSNSYGVELRAPDGSATPVPLKFTPLLGFSAEWQQKDSPTGRFTLALFRRLPHEQKQEIATRTFQVEAYRIPTFEVQLSGAAKVRLDAPFTVKAVARYYAGGGAAGLKIQWNVARRAAAHEPKGREGFLFASSTQFARPSATRAPEVIRREATLDDEGAAELTIHPELDVDGSPRVYRFEVTVTGPDEQQVSATQDTTALPPFTLGMKLQRYAKSATELAPQIIALGVDDQAIAGQEVLVRLYRRLWHSHLRETNFATGEAKYVTEQEDQKLLEKPVRTGADALTVPLPVKEAGVYVVELFARDKLGRVQTLSADLYVGGKGAVAWQKPHEGVFVLSTEKKTYRPGETARVILQSPFQQGRALVIVEEPKGNRYHWIEVEGGKAVFEQRITNDVVPNLPLHVVLLRGRIGESKVDDARHRPQTVAASLDLEILPAPNQVQVSLSHPETARPGATIEVGVKLADDRGKPLAGEVTLWLVDEAVLSLAKEGPLDPLSAFIDRNARMTSVRDTRNLVVGRIAEEEEPGGDGEDAAGLGGKKRVVRKNFKTVPYYVATLEVGEGGQINVPITLSDDLTNFKVRAVAASGMQRFGTAQSTLRVRLPLIVQPQLPRFVRQGDRFWPGGISRLLEGAEGPATVSIELTGQVDQKGGQQQIDLKSNKPASVLVPATVQASNSGEAAELTVKVDVTRKSDGVGDAFEVKLPLLPDRAIERAGYFTRFQSGPNRLQPFPEKPRAGTGQQKILVTSVPGVMELAAGLDYLARYPHGCLEQKLSQVYPYVAQLGLLRRLELADKPARVEGPKALLEELGQYQDERGLFGYWPGSSGDVALTAQALAFMAAARHSGLKPDEKLEGRAVAALQRVLRSDYQGALPEYRANQQIEALRALSRAGKGDEHYLIDLFHHREAFDSVSLADLSIAMEAQPALFGPNLKELTGELWDKVILKLHDGQPVFSGVTSGRKYWSGEFLGSEISTTSAVFEALTGLTPADERLPRVRDGLLSAADATRGFGSTFDNRRAIEALGVYLDKAAHPALDAAVNLSSGQQLQLSAEHKVRSATIESDLQLSATVGGAPVAARVAYSYLPEAAGDHVSALPQGLIVTRGATVLHEGGAQEPRRDDKAGDTIRVAQGDLIELDAQLTLTDNQVFVALVVPFAAGLEPMNAALEGTRSDAKPSREDSVAPTYVQRVDEETRYYFDRLAKGTYSFHFRVRAASEGSFVHPAPWAELMYQESVRGRGEGMRVVVTGAHEK